MPQAVLSAIGLPLAVCLVLGTIEFLQDYQAVPKFTPALIAGGLVAAKTAAAWLGVNVVRAGAPVLARTAGLSKATPPPTTT